jgi:hypothetical protein
LPRLQVLEAASSQTEVPYAIRGTIAFIYGFQRFVT